MTLLEVPLRTSNGCKRLGASAMLLGLGTLEYHWKHDSVLVLSAMRSNTLRIEGTCVLIFMRHDLAASLSTKKNTLRCFIRFPPKDRGPLRLEGSLGTR